MRTLDPFTIYTVLASTSDIGVAALVFAGVVVTAGGTYLVARRTHSGAIKDSEAAKLWDESTKMRLELREQVEALQEEIRQLKIDKAKDAEMWRARVADLEAKIAELKARVAQLEAALNG